MQSAARAGTLWLVTCASLVGAVELGFERAAPLADLLAAVDAELATHPPVGLEVWDRGAEPDWGRLSVLERRLPDFLALARSGEPAAAETRTAPTDAAARARAYWLSASAELAAAGWEAANPETWWRELEALARTPQPLEWLAAPPAGFDPWPALRARANETSLCTLAAWAAVAEPAALRERVWFEWAFAHALLGHAEEADAIRAQLVAAAPESPWGRRAARARQRAAHWSSGSPVPDVRLRDLDGNAVSLAAEPGGQVLLAFPSSASDPVVARLGSVARRLGPAGLRVVIVASGGDRRGWRRATEGSINVLDVVDALEHSPARDAWAIGDGVAFVLLGPNRTLLAHTVDPGPLLARVEDLAAGDSRSANR